MYFIIRYVLLNLLYNLHAIHLYILEYIEFP